jgi:hypothetical protein
MPENADKIGSDKDDDDQSEYFIHLEVVQCFQDWITFILNIILYIVYQFLVVMVIN